VVAAWSCRFLKDRHLRLSWPYHGHAPILRAKLCQSRQDARRKERETPNPLLLAGVCTNSFLSANNMWQEFDPQ
jgi:hypothetical protein